MANHGFVKTTTRIFTKNSITKILNKLNKQVFKNILKIEYINGRGDRSSWGKDIWDITWINGYNHEESKVCWLNNARSFEIRHGSGSYFASWIDTYITNEIAFAHNGIISDDGCSETCKGIKNKYPTFLDYMKHMSKYGTYDSFVGFTKMENECAPSCLKALEEDILKGNELQIKRS